MIYFLSWKVTKSFGINMILTFIAILILSLIMSSWSMRDFEIPKEITKYLFTKNVRGTIVFFKGKISHYSSSESSRSSSFR